MKRARRYAVVGRPAAHSLSPWLHAQFARATQRRLVYAAIEPPAGDDKDDGFARAAGDFFAGGGDGLNVTVPFKAKALQFADHASAFARRAGVANVLARKGGRIMAYNTDGGGIMRALAAALPGGAAGRRVALLGAGGAARAAAFALGEGKPAALQIYNRTADRARALAALTGAEFCESPPVGANIVINATSAAAQGELALPPAEVFANADLAMDLMYGEAALPWLRHAAASGAKQTADGIVMLAWQAALSFAVWEGVLPTVAPLLQALAAPASGGRGGRA